MRLLLLLLAGCWSTPRPTGPPALLRRHHAVGDVLRVCERADSVMFVAGMDPIVMSIRQISDEHFLAVEPKRVELRRDTLSGSVRIDARGQAPSVVDMGRLPGTPFFVDDRNRVVGTTFDAPAVTSDADRFDVATTPYTNDIVRIAYPERAIRRNETFPLHVRRTLHKQAAVPSTLTIDATFTVTEVAADHVELVCKGTQIEEARAGKQHVRVELALTCRARIARRDGRTARWWIDTNGTFEQSGQRYPARAKTHYDIAVGDVDPSVCSRAAEP